MLIKLLNFKIFSIIVIIINCNPNYYFNVILIFNSLFWLCCAAIQTSTLNPELKNLNYFSSNLCSPNTSLQAATEFQVSLMSVAQMLQY